VTGLRERRGVERVYPPSEDSGLLAAAAAARVDGLVLEVGTGSGWVAERVSGAADRVVGSDINPHACRAARERGVEAVRADLVSAFPADTFDAVLFNPPYLPDLPVDHPEGEPFGDDWMGRALSGGDTGREVIARFLDDVDRVVVPGGTVLLVVSTLSGFEEVVSLAERAGFGHERVRDESYPFETLTVLALSPEA